MPQCSGCGNEYEHTFKVIADSRTYVFDCFECAIHKLAPVCKGCGCRILGHGVESGELLFCSAHCARTRGVRGFTTHLGPPPPQPPRP